MPKKRTVIILLIILAVSLLISGVNMFINRSTMRVPTQQEIEAYAPYTIDWKSAVSTEGTEKEILLSLCTYAGEETIGENLYKTYTSDTLGDYLYHFQEIMEIALLNDDVLYIQYYDTQGNMVTLAYSDAGLTEKSIYDVATDTMFYEYGDTAEIWTKFRTGFRWVS